jgi:RHS repeat-associated protein
VNSMGRSDGGCPSFRRIRPARRFAGRKLASGFFGRGRRTCVRRTPRKSLHSRRVARPAATKSASGVRYYGLRYYNPSTGRWLSRDPVEETSCSNLYGFVANDSINQIDVLGLLAPGSPLRGDTPEFIEVMKVIEETPKPPIPVPFPIPFPLPFPNPAPAPNPSPAPDNPPPLPSPPDDKKCSECTFKWLGYDRGGNPQHTEYVRRLSAQHMGQFGNERDPIG